MRKAYLVPLNVFLWLGCVGDTQQSDETTNLVTAAISAERDAGPGIPSDGEPDFPDVEGNEGTAIDAGRVDEPDQPNDGDTVDGGADDEPNIDDGSLFAALLAPPPRRRSARNDDGPDNTPGGLRREIESAEHWGTLVRGARDELRVMEQRLVVLARYGGSADDIAELVAHIHIAEIGIKRAEQRFSEAVGKANRHLDVVRDDIVHIANELLKTYNKQPIDPQDVEAVLSLLAGPVPDPADTTPRLARPLATAAEIRDALAAEARAGLANAIDVLEAARNYRALRSAVPMLPTETPR